MIEVLTIILCAVCVSVLLRPSPKRRASTMSQVGKPKERTTIVPLEEPVPSKEPVVAPVETPEKEPAKSG